MRKKGDAATNVIMFVTTMLAVSITLLWAVKHNFPFQALQDDINNELLRIQVEAGVLCSNDFYEARINPELDYGVLMFRGSEACISANRYSSICSNMVSADFCQDIKGIFRCGPLVCDIGINEEINLKDITYIYIKKNDTITLDVQ